MKAIDRLLYHVYHVGKWLLPVIIVAGLAFLYFSSTGFDRMGVMP